MPDVSGCGGAVRTRKAQYPIAATARTRRRTTTVPRDRRGGGVWGSCSMSKTRQKSTRDGEGLQWRGKSEIRDPRSEVGDPRFEIADSRFEIRRFDGRKGAWLKCCTLLPQLR